jgi:hypothetical protein
VKKFKSIRDAAWYLWDAERGKPYVWAGDDSIAGWDCSGLVISGLKAVGVLPTVGDWTAEGLSVYFKDRDIKHVKPGCLLFYNHNHRVSHVVIVWAIIGNRLLTLGASGGGRHVKTVEDAVKYNAFVKVRPALPGWVKAVDPFLGE